MPLYCGACGKRRTGAYEWEGCPNCGTVPKRYRGVCEVAADSLPVPPAARRGAFSVWPVYLAMCAGVAALLWRCLQ